MLGLSWLAWLSMSLCRLIGASSLGIRSKLRSLDHLGIVSSASFNPNKLDRLVHPPRIPCLHRGHCILESYVLMRVLTKLM